MADFSSTTISKLWLIRLTGNGSTPYFYWTPLGDRSNYHSTETGGRVTVTNTINVVVEPVMTSCIWLNNTLLQRNYQTPHDAVINGYNYGWVNAAGSGGNYPLGHLYMSGTSYTAVSHRLGVYKLNYVDGQHSTYGYTYGTSSRVNYILTHVIAGSHLGTGYRTLVVKAVINNTSLYIAIPGWSSNNNIRLDIYGYGNNILGAIPTGTTELNNILFRTDLSINLSDVVSGTGIYNALNSLQLPSHMDNTSTASTIKSNADTLWDWISNAYGSSWSYYSQAKSKYDEIVAAYSWIPTRDQAYNSLITITTPTNTTVQTTAKTAKDNASSFWSTLNSKDISEWSNYSTAKAKYDAIVAGHAATVTRDTRLTKKADKTELNTSNNKLTFNQSAVYSKGTSDYSSINSTLSSVNNKLN